jgi:hypothetical protein
MAAKKKDTSKVTLKEKTPEIEIKNGDDDCSAEFGYRHTIKAGIYGLGCTDEEAFSKLKSIVWRRIMRERAELKIVCREKTCRYNRPCKTRLGASLDTLDVEYNTVEYGACPDGLGVECRLKSDFSVRSSCYCQIEDFI